MDNTRKRRALRRRDGDRCMICGGGLNFDATHQGHPEFPTIDHIVPLNSGGSNRLENLRLAHRLCNNERNNIPGDTLPLELVKKLNSKRVSVAKAVIKRAGNNCCGCGQPLNEFSAVIRGGDYTTRSIPGAVFANFKLYHEKC